MTARRPFATLLVVAGLGLLLAAALLLVAFPPPPLGNAFKRCTESGSLCSNLVRIGHQVGTPLFLALLPWSLCRGLCRGFRQWWITGRAVGRLRAHGTRALPAGLQTVCDRLGIEGRVTIVDTDMPIALCHGLWHPRVWLSTGTLDLLSFQEAAAVLRHELAHVRFRHPSQLLIARSLAAAFPFLPVLRELAAAVARAQELAADRAVICAGERHALGRALLTLVDAPGAAAARLPVPGMIGALDARLDQLAGATDVPLRLSRRSLALTWLAFALGLLLLRLSGLGIPPQHTLLGLVALPPLRFDVPGQCLAASGALAGALQIASAAVARDRP